MPNQIDMRPDLYQRQLTHDPLRRNTVDPRAYVKSPLEITKEIIFGAVTRLLGDIKDAIGLDLDGLNNALGGNVVRFFENLIAFLDGIDLNNDGFDRDDARRLFTELVVEPFVPLQELIDGIFQSWSGTTEVGRPVRDAIDSILNILGVGKNAQSSADTANIGVASIKAELAGGYSDEFNYPSATWLPADKYTPEWAGAQTTGTMGPNGAGTLVYRPGLGLGDRWVVYRRSDGPMNSQHGSVAMVLTKPPHSGGGVTGNFFLMGRRSATDKSCLRAVVNLNSVTVQTVNASGTGTNVTTTLKESFTAAAGDTWEMTWFENPTNTFRVMVYRNGIHIAEATFNNSTLTGRHWGWGIYHSIYTWTSGHPVPEFAGVAWHSRVSSLAATYENSGGDDPAILAECKSAALQQLSIADSPVPSSETSPGQPGQTAHDDNYWYVCVAENRWRRVGLQW